MLYTLQLKHLMVEIYSSVKQTLKRFIADTIKTTVLPPFTVYVDLWTDVSIFMIINHVYIH